MRFRLVFCALAMVWLFGLGDWRPNPSHSFLSPVRFEIKSNTVESERAGRRESYSVSTPTPTPTITRMPRAPKFGTYKGPK